jgi:hypothetical protein
MDQPTVRFPVACPKCGKERLTEFPVDELVDALQRGLDICLVATCHEMIWTATDLELEQIREYLRAVRLPKPAAQEKPPELRPASPMRQRA